MAQDKGDNDRRHVAFSEFSDGFGFDQVAKTVNVSS
jgi:hypothetical protein